MPSAEWNNSQPHRAIVLAPFFSLEGPSRPRHVAAALAATMPVEVVTADFDHTRKARREPRQAGEFAEIVYLKALPYSSNVGVARLASHILFALSAARYWYRRRRRYSVIYATLPLNLLAWLVFSLSRGARRIADVVDIWPDSLPFSPRLRRLLLPAFAVWKRLYARAIRRADLVLAVSDTFLSDAARHAGKDVPLRRFYIGGQRLSAPAPKQPLFTLAYVGNLGRLYDFETLLDALESRELRNTMQVFIVGAGDRRDWLLTELKCRQIRHRFFGVVHRKEELAAILATCHAGFNGYIRTNAAFSYKASTYLAAGLPLVNSMQGDLGRLVELHGLGENYRRQDRSQLTAALLRLRDGDLEEVAARCRRFFESELEAGKIHAQMLDFFERVLVCPRDRFANPAAAPLSQEP